MKKLLLDGAQPIEASPYKSLAEELETLRKSFHVAVEQYGDRIDGELIRLRERVVAAGEVHRTLDAKPRARPKPGRGPIEGNSTIHDLRDMLTLLRTVEIKPAAGRRKDLKKIESVVEEVKLIIERWS